MDVGPVIDVVSVSVLSDFGLPLQVSVVVLTGLPLRGGAGGLYFIRAVEVDLSPLAADG